MKRCFSSFHMYTVAIADTMQKIQECGCFAIQICCIIFVCFFFSQNTACFLILILLWHTGFVINNQLLHVFAWPLLILSDLDTASSLTLVDEFFRKTSFWKSLSVIEMCIPWADRIFLGGVAKALGSPPSHHSDKLWSTELNDSCGITCL